MVFLCSEFKPNEDRLKGMVFTIFEQNIVNFRIKNQPLSRWLTDNFR